MSNGDDHRLLKASRRYQEGQRSVHDPAVGNMRELISKPTEDRWSRFLGIDPQRVGYRRLMRSYRKNRRNGDR